MFKKLIAFVSLFLFIAALDWFNDIKHNSAKNIDRSDVILQNIYSKVNAGDHDAAMPDITRAIESNTYAGDHKTMAWLYEMMSVVHERRYHFHFAIDALKQANKHVEKARYQSRIGYLENHIAGMQTERQLTSKYVSGENKGLAKTMTDNITIAYVYINDANNAKWTGKRRLVNQASIDKVLAWYKREASPYDIDSLNFKVRYFVMHSPKGIEKSWLRQHGTFSYLANAFIQQSPYADFTQFIKAMKAGNKHQEVALVFHSNYQGRSYALRCRHNTNDNHCPAEYAMITENLSKKKHAWLIPQVQAHELLHLFGADDLYNINSAQNYAVTDIMNYYSSDLIYSSIDPITAWAIGWHALPPTPFPVEK